MESPIASHADDPSQGPLVQVATNDKPAKTFRLFDLPQELQDTIFELAFPFVPDLRIHTKRSWTRNEQYQRLGSTTHIIRPFPEVKVAEFLVCKKFFDNAARAWLQNQWFDMGLDTLTIKDCKESILISAPNVVVHAAYGDLRASSHLGTKKMRLLITIEDFQELAPRFPWEVMCTDEELKTSRLYVPLSSIRGLLSFEIIAKESRRSWLGIDGRPGLDSEIWKTNVQRLEELFKEEVLKPSEVRAPVEKLDFQDQLQESKEVEPRVKEMDWVQTEVVIWRVLGFTTLCALFMMRVSSREGIRKFW